MLFSTFLCETKSATCSLDAIPHADNFHTRWLASSELCENGTDPTVTESILVMDDRVLCEEMSHGYLQYVSAVLIGTSSGLSTGSAPIHQD